MMFVNSFFVKYDIFPSHKMQKSAPFIRTLIISIRLEQLCKPSSVSDIHLSTMYISAHLQPLVEIVGPT